MTGDETEVAIVGAGPAGLVLAHLLAARGIDAVVLEQRDRAYVEQRVRAGVLEHPSVELLRSLGLAGRLDREGLPHRGIQLAFDGVRHRIDFLELTGRSITVYGQQELVKDLVAARLDAGGRIVFEALDVTPADVDTDHPSVRYRSGDVEHVVRCRVVAGCDGSFGVCGPLVPGRAVAEHTYPFAWLGILAEAAPTQDELVYTSHDRGFALYSMRSPTVTRLYLQVAPDEQLTDWSDDRIWSELAARLPLGDGFRLNTGPIIDRGITAMHSSVSTPMRHGSLLIAGDAAHIVPATGAKGMNLAIADAAVMAAAIDEALHGGRPERLADYTPACLGRVWRTQHFSHRMTTMLHRFDDDPFRRRLQRTELEIVTSSVAAATDLAEHYVGLPFATLAAGAPMTGDLHPFAPAPPGTHPPLLSPEYRSTGRRAPAQPLLQLPVGLTDPADLTGPVFGHDTVREGDADLTGGADGEAIGQRIIVTGRLLDGDGRPIRRSLVEVWQANASGRYRHAGDQWPGTLDPNFTGGGRTLTDDDGTYRFVTVKPGAYPWGNHPNAWRPAHIHFSVYGWAFTQRLVTQMYFPDDPLFFQDPIFNAVADPAARRRLVARYDHDVTEPEWALGFRFDIVLRGPAATPFEEPGDG